MNVNAVDFRLGFGVCVCDKNITIISEWRWAHRKMKETTKKSTMNDQKSTKITIATQSTRTHTHSNAQSHTHRVLPWHTHACRTLMEWWPFNRVFLWFWYASSMPWHFQCETCTHQMDMGSHSFVSSHCNRIHTACRPIKRSAAHNVKVCTISLLAFLPLTASGHCVLYGHCWVLIWMKFISRF